MRLFVRVICMKVPKCTTLPTCLCTPGINLWWIIRARPMPLKVRQQLKGRGMTVKMALKEPGAQQDRPISVKVATDDSQFSQPIIGALIYAQRGHSHPLTNERPVPEVSHDDKSVQGLTTSHRKVWREHTVLYLQTSQGRAEEEETDWRGNKNDRL